MNVHAHSQRSSTIANYLTFFGQINSMIFSGRIEIVELSGHISATTQSKAEHKPANRNIRVPAASNVYPQCVSTWRVGVT